MNLTGDEKLSTTICNICDECPVDITHYFAKRQNVIYFYLMSNGQSEVNKAYVPRSNCLKHLIFALQ